MLGDAKPFLCNNNRVADKEVLQPSYDQLATAIRKVQSDALVFFAAVTWDKIVPVGFTAAPGQRRDSLYSLNS